MAHKNFSRSALNAKLKSELVVICLENSLNTSGIKLDLVARILEWQDRPIVTEAAIDTDLEALTDITNLEQCLEASTTPTIDSMICDDLGLDLIDADQRDLMAEQFYVNAFNGALGEVLAIAETWIAIQSGGKITTEFFSNPYSAALSLYGDRHLKQVAKERAIAIIALTTDLDYM